MIHELKILPWFYAPVRDGVKTFEVRENDHHFQPGDTVVLREFDPHPINPADTLAARGYTDNPPLEFTIGYVYVLDSRNVAFSLLPLKSKKKA